MRTKSSISPEQRFWLKVDRSGGPDSCWEWQGFQHNGYGWLTSNKRCYRAHRLTWELTNGPIPEGMSVLHRCDNPPCCNPAHLFLGTDLDNVQDAIRKGRRASRKGTQNAQVKLSEDDVREIREWRAAGATQPAIAAIYGVSQQTISNIIHRKRWDHLD